MATTTDLPSLPSSMTKEERFVIFASSVGTVFEWYDFYLYAVLAPFFARRRIRRRRNLCRRARASRRAWLCDRLGPDHRDDRARICPGDHHFLPRVHGRHGVRPMGLAHSVYRVGHCVLQKTMEGGVMT
jgi:hypothetical protein